MSTTATTATLLSRMAKAGIPLSEAHWYHTVGRPRQFKAPGDVPRMRSILKTMSSFYSRRPTRQMH